MKHVMKLSIAVLVALAPSLGFAQDKEAKKMSLDTEDAKINYIIGMNVGGTFKQTGLKFDREAFLRGIDAMLNDLDPELDEAAVQAVMIAFQARVQEVQKKLMEEQKKKMAEIEAKRALQIPANQELIADFKKDDNVKSTSSGLKYRIIKPGDGETPMSSDKVKVHYRGMLLDGKIFDSSYDRGEPSTFPVGGVISGWTEALQLMKEGGKWQVLIPAEIAYGAKQMGDAIPPNASLFFEMELIKVL